jgi:type I restriction enzyme S subunit
MQLETTNGALDLAPNWVMRPIASLCHILSGGTPPTAQTQYWDGDIPWVSAKDLKASRLRDAIDHVSPSAIGAGTRLAPAGSVFLLVRGMGLAKDLPVALALRPMAFNQDVKALIPKQPGTGPFIRAAIYSNRKQLLSRIVPSAHGTLTLNLDDIETFEIPVPADDQEAKAIGDALGFVQDKIEHALSELACAENLKRAAMHALFTRGLRGEARKDTEIGLVPESWDVVEFCNVREWLQYGTSTPCTYEPTAYPVLRIPNIAPGSVNAQDIKFGTLRADEAARYRLQKGDLIFIRTNGVIERLGACAVYAEEPEGALFASYLIRARLKLDRINPHFAAYFFGSEQGTSIVAGRATPAADGKYNLNTATIDGLPIPLPPTLDEQAEIVSVLDVIDRKINLHRRKRALLDELFKALLHKLMTGELRVADLDLSALAEKGAKVAA